MRTGNRMKAGSQPTKGSTKELPQWYWAWSPRAGEQWSAHGEAGFGKVHLLLFVAVSTPIPVGQLFSAQVQQLTWVNFCCSMCMLVAKKIL